LAKIDKPWQVSYNQSYMKTVNISLPDSLAVQIEKLLGQNEYSSRSEVVRTALRVFFSFQTPAPGIELVPFQKRPLTEIRRDLLESGHSQKFTANIINSLKKSSVYKNTAQSLSLLQIKKQRSLI